MAPRCLVVLVITVVQVTAHQQSFPSRSACPSSCTCPFKADPPVRANCSRRGLTSVPLGLAGSLQLLSLDHNNITLLKCTDLSQMSHLNVLDLSFNKLGSISGTFSHENGGCTSKSLHRKNNSLESRVQAVFENSRKKRSCETPFLGLPNLRVLNMSNNWLSTLNSRSFLGLHSLEILRLQNNCLVTLPNTIFQGLDNLLELDIRSNEFENYQDQALSVLTNLKNLSMNGLKFPCVLGPGFRNLSQLEFLDFNQDGSCLTDCLPEYFFWNVTSQKNLSILMIGCRIKFVHPKAFSALPTLVKLDLSHNDQLHCDNMVSASAAFPSTQIEVYNVNRINNKPFLRLTAATFRYIGNTTLKVLKMTKNLILIIDSAVASSLPTTLEVLDLSDNCVLRPNFIFTSSFLRNLRTLFISRQNKVRVSLSLFHNVSIVEDESECHILNSTLTHRDTYLESGNTYWHQTQFTNKQLSSPNNSELQNNVQLDIKLERILNQDNLSFSQWTYLVAHVCPTYRPDIPLTKLDDTAVWLKKESRQLIRRVLVEKSIYSKFQLEMNERERHIQTFSIPRSLQKIYASELKLGHAIPDFRVEFNDVLWFIDASKNFLLCFEGPMLGLNALKHFDLSGNFAAAINPHFFKGLQNISYLILSYNELATSFELDVDGLILSYLGNLTNLSLKGNDLRIMHSNAIARNVKLRRLDLSHNNLLDLPNIINHRHIKYINAYDNRIPFLSHDSMHGLDLQFKLSPKISVDLRKNPLVCDCSSLCFLIWYSRTKVTFIKSERYTCVYINGTRIALNEAVSLASQLWRKCHGERSFFASIIMFLLMALILTCSAFVSYYSYRLLFYVYLSKQRFFYHLYEPEQRRLRDVFLVYDDQDANCRQHVMQVLLPNLSRQGLTYHLSEMGLDSPSAGRSVREVVEESVLGGRKTVVLLTNDIFQDEEKQLEVGMAKIAEEMLGSCRLLFLAVHSINPEQLPTHMYRILRVSRIISYSPGNEQFWIQLAREIKC